MIIVIIRLRLNNEGALSYESHPLPLKDLGRNLLPVEGHKTLESLFELRPFVFDHSPDKASLEDAPGDF